MRLLLAAAAAVAALAACEDPEVVAAQDRAAQEAAAAMDQPPQQGDAQVQIAQANQVAPPAGPDQVATEIDWEAARAARAGSSVNSSNVTTQNATGAPPEVPVLLPSGVVQAQNARPPAMVMTDDGYFATYEMPRYDAIVNGTKTAYGAQRADRGDEMDFTISEGSAQLAFSRFGADYLIEFECRQVDGAASCVTEEEAQAFAESLFVAETR